MRTMKIAAVLALVLMSFSLLAAAGQNKYGVAETRKITFSEPIRVGDTLLPAGEYKIQHTMEGENHIMVFTQLKSALPATSRVKCQLVPLEKKATRTEVMYGHNQNETHFLQELTFAGDTATHVF